MMSQKLVRRNRKPHFIAIVSVAILGSLFGLSIFAQDAGTKTPIQNINKRIAKLNEDLKKVEVYLKVPVGTILPFGGPKTEVEKLKKRGWLFCNGQQLSRYEYEELYHVIGTAHGKGDSNEMFRVPDLRGRFVRGVDHKAGRDPDADNRTTEYGGNIKDNVGSLQEDAIGKHNHPIKSAHANEDRIIRGGSEDDPPAVAGYPHHYTDKPHTEESGGLETRPKNIYVNWIIYAGAK